MSKDYLEYKFEQAVGEQLKGILTAEDLANMVITVKIEFNNKKETEEEKEAREKEEKKWTRAGLKNKFRIHWDSQIDKNGNKNNRQTSAVETIPEDQRRARSGPAFEKWLDKIKKDRAELYEEYFPGEKEDEFLER